MRILYVASTRIGDAVLSSGVLNHLIERYPDARITLACGPAAAPLFEATPGVTRRIVLVKRRWAGHWLDLWRQAVGTHWDIVVDLRASALAWLVRARTRSVTRPSDALEHRTRQFAATIGLETPLAPRIWLAPSHRQVAARLIPGDGPVLAVGPTANWGAKQWPALRFAELIARLTAPGAALAGATVAVLGAEGERGAAAPVIDSIPEPRRIDLVGATDLLTAYACLERSSLYIGNDSGLMHLAAASGVPTLGLFGPSREVHYAPVGEYAAVVRTALSYEALVGAPGYDYRRQDTLMGSLGVDAVEDAAVALWRRARGDAA